MITTVHPVSTATGRLAASLGGRYHGAAGAPAGSLTHGRYWTEVTSDRFDDDHLVRMTTEAAKAPHQTAAGL